MLNIINENQENQDSISEDIEELNISTSQMFNKDDIDKSYGDLSSIVSSNEDRPYDEEEEDDDEKEYGVKISQELCVKIINKTFDSMMIIGFFILFCLWIASPFDFNFFPFKIADVNDWWYQIAQIIFLGSYWTTNILLLRGLIILGYIFFIIWAIKNQDYPSMDFYMFTYIYIIINFKNIIQLLYEKRPIKFDDMREKVFEEVFDGIMTRNEYIILSKISLIRELPKSGFYCKINDKCNNLSILIDGRIRIFKNSENIKTTFINNGEFIDSAEWLLKNAKKRKGGKRFKYFMKADDNCIYLTWPREILAVTLKEHPEIQHKLDGALGIDVSKKLFNNSSLY